MRSGNLIGWALALVIFAAPAAAQTPPAPQAPQAKRPAPSPAPTRPAPSAGSVAQNPSVEGSPTATTATYGDWVVRCSQSGDTQFCEVAQTIFLQGQQAPIAVVAIGRDKKTSP